MLWSPAIVLAIIVKNIALAIVPSGETAIVCYFLCTAIALTMHETLLQTIGLDGGYLQTTPPIPVHH